MKRFRNTIYMSASGPTDHLVEHPEGELVYYGDVQAEIARLTTERDKAQRLAQFECAGRHEAYAESDRWMARAMALLFTGDADEATLGDIRKATDAYNEWLTARRKP